MTLIDQIRDMISEGETEKSLEELYIYVKENNADIIDNLVMLRSRMRNLQHAVQMGTMSSQDAAFERAKINEAILKMLPQLTPEYLAQASKRREPIQQSASNRSTAYDVPAQSKTKYYLMGAGGVLLLLILLAKMCGGNDEGSTGQEPTSVTMESTPDAQHTNTAPPSTETESAATEDNLLQHVLATHNGYAIWQPNTGEGYFEVDVEHETCQEYGADGAAHFTFQIQSIDANYVTIYDPSRGMRLRIGEAEMLVRYDADNTWKRLYSGAWITPTQ